MKRFFKFLKSGLAAIVLGLMAGSCGDDVNDDSYYTFTGDTVASYCGSSESYSVFSALLDDTGLGSLLSTYGHYTCFLPDDAAFARYFATIGKQLSLIHI